ncbi:alpha/beta fold hydrolase [Euzebya sp.]|uniref:alpha/beta fold hydrolase n=1 Tax=Euzebya sp. TaxID=1971409 RepID=UPI0035148B04
MPHPQISPGVYWAKDRTVTTADGARIAFRVLRDDDLPPGPTVALLSGFLCPDTWWHHLTPQLVAAGYRVVMLHYRGIATSTAPEWPDDRSMTVERYAEDVLDVLHAAGVHEVNLIGHSMGGQVMVEVARRIPDRVTSMTSITGAYRSPTRGMYGQGWLIEPAMTQLIRLLRPLRGQMGTAVWRTVWRTVPFLPLGRAATAFSARTPDDIVASYEAHAVTLTGEYFIAALEAMHRHDPGDVLGDLDVPTLVISGDTDPFTPRAVAEEMVEGLPQAELLVVPDTSHGAILEEPEVVGDAVLTHLAKATGHLPA